MTVPLTGGVKAEKGHTPVTQSEKMLGAMTSPDGNSSGTIRMMQEKVQLWVDLV